MKIEKVNVVAFFVSFFFTVLSEVLLIMHIVSINFDFSKNIATTHKTLLLPVALVGIPIYIIFIYIDKLKKRKDES